MLKLKRHEMTISDSVAGAVRGHGTHIDRFESTRGVKTPCYPCYSGHPQSEQ